MPTIKVMDGVVIRMYPHGREHEPPHIHAVYGEDIIAVVITTGEILYGSFPNRRIKIVTEWVRANSKDLLEMWETQRFKKL